MSVLLWPLFGLLREQSMPIGLSDKMPSVREITNEYLLLEQLAGDVNPVFLVSNEMKKV
jgi:hypothetical protein